MGLSVPLSRAQEPLSTTLSAKQDSSQRVSYDTIRIGKSAIEDPIIYKAEDSAVFDLKHRKVYLYGKANVKYGSMDLTSAVIVIDFSKRELYATGRYDSANAFVDRPHFDDGEQPVDADTMIYNFDTKRGRTYGVRLAQGDGFILCNKVLRDDDKNIYSDRGQYTTCNLEHPHFYLQTRKLKIIPDNKIVFGPSNLVIEDVPTPLYLPFGMFPIKKGQKSGIIPPEYGVTGVFGPYLRGMGYFFAINDHLDQAVRGDFYFRGSWGLHSDTRYAQRYKYRGSLSLGYSNLLPQSLEREDPGFKAGILKTFEIKWNHTQDQKARPGTSFGANVNMKKGRYNQLNSVDPTQIVANTFNSSVTYSKVLANGKANFTTGLTHSQNTGNGDFTLSLPNISFGLMRVTPFAKKTPAGQPKWYENIGFSYQMDAENRVFTKDSLFFAGKAFDKFQNGVSHSIPVTFGSFKVFRDHFSITPTFNYHEVWYTKTMMKSWNQAEKKLDTSYNYGFSRASDYNGSVNVSTQVFGTYQLASKKISAIRHQMTPSVGVTYNPDFTASRFNYYYETQVDTTGKRREYSIYEGGIKGGPPSVERGQIDFSIANNVQAKVLKQTDTSSKYENISFLDNLVFGGNYNFLADSFRLSNISVSGFTTLFKNLRVNANASLDPYHTEGNKRMDKQFEITKSGRIGTWRSAFISLTTDINADMFKKKDKKEQGPTAPLTPETQAEQAAMQRSPSSYANFKVPWSLNVNTSMQYSRVGYRTRWTPTLSLRGDFNLTPNWKIGTSTGYDFDNKKIAYTQFNITRNLHCWTIDFQWIPDGIRKSFSFTIRVNSAMLQDLKVNKRRLWYDQ